MIYFIHFVIKHSIKQYYTHENAYTNNLMSYQHLITDINNLIYVTNNKFILFIKPCATKKSKKIK